MLFFLFVLGSFVNLNLFLILSSKLRIESRDFFLLGYINLVIKVTSLKANLIDNNFFSFLFTLILFFNFIL